MQGLHPSKAHAKMRENIGQYVDGCAELGTPSAHRPVMCTLREHTAMPLCRPLQCLVVTLSDASHSLCVLLCADT